MLLQVFQVDHATIYSRLYLVYVLLQVFNLFIEHLFLALAALDLIIEIFTTCKQFFLCDFNFLYHFHHFGALVTDTLSLYIVLVLNVRNLPIEFLLLGL